MNSKRKLTLVKKGDDMEEVKIELQILKELFMKLDAKLDAHISDEMHDFKSVKAHIEEIVNILRDIER